LKDGEADKKGSSFLLKFEAIFKRIDDILSKLEGLEERLEEKTK